MVSVATMTESVGGASLMGVSLEGASDSEGANNGVGSVGGAVQGAGAGLGGWDQGGGVASYTN